MTVPFPDVSDTPLADLVSLRGRRAVVTGGARGLGRAIAHRLAEAGADLVIIDIDGDAARSAAEDLAARHGRTVVAVAADVADAASVATAADGAVAALSGIDIWVNNAGVFPNADILAMPEAMWDTTLAVNAKGTFLGAQEAARRMQSTGRGGVIVNVVSTAGFRAPFPGMAAYVSSKHAVRGLTRSLAVDLAPRGIRVLGVAPSYVPTEGTSAAAEAGAAAAAAAGVEMPSLGVMQTGRIGRLGTPDDIARVVLFAVSDLSVVMTGSTILADGGETL